MSDMFVGSQAPLYQNVCITKRNKKGKIIEQRFAKNRITKLMLFGLGRFLLGHYNDSTPDKMYEVIPRYLALGTNESSGQYDDGVTITPSVDDTRLLNEIKYATTTGATEAIKRIFIAERNICKLNTKFSDPYIKVSIKTYISSSVYNGIKIGEAGLFSKEKDNNCLARVCFPPIEKTPDDVLDIQWDITLLSYGETIYPDNIKIENGNKVTIPLMYTNKHYIESGIGLKRFWTTNTLGTENNPEIFSWDEYGNISFYNDMTKDKIKEETDWYQYLVDNELDNKFDYIVNLLLNSKLNDATNDGQRAYYLIHKELDYPTPFYFGNLYSNVELKNINKDELAMFLMYSEEQNISNEDTGYKYFSTSSSGDYTIYDAFNNQTTYCVINNQFHKNTSISKGNISWAPTGYYMYNGYIVNSNGVAIEYCYDNTTFYKYTVTINDIYLNQYLNYSHSSDEKFYLFEYNEEYDMIQPTGYSIDLLKDCEIYINDEDTYYHLSVDNYWVMGDYVKLIPILTPTNATDKSINWKIQNSNIAKINWDGVTHAWNLGETLAIASTTNDLRAKCIIDVVKEDKYIPVDEIEVNPKEVILYVDGNENQYEIVEANVFPLFATNTTVIWSKDYNIQNCIEIIELGNNKVKVILNGSGNVGVGYIQATSQSGKYDTCLVKVLFKSDGSDCDCPDPSHREQEA